MRKKYDFFRIACYTTASYFRSHSNYPNMKKSILAFCLICAISLISCDKVKDKLFPSFETEINGIHVTIPLALAGTEISNSSTVLFNLDSAIRAETANTFGINNLGSVKVQDVGIFVSNADDLNDISNFKSVRVTLASNTNAKPVVVASANIADTPATSLNITATNSPELKDYLKGNQLTYTVMGDVRRTTTKNLNATLSITLAIK